MRLTLLFLLLLVSLCSCDNYQSKSYVKSGNEFIERYDYQNAILNFSKAIELNSKSDKAYAGIAVSYLYLKDISNASTYANKSLSINPNNKRALLAKGSCWFMLHDYDKAITFYQRVLSIDKNNSAAYDDMALAFANKGDYIIALDCVDKALKYCKKDERMRLQMVQNLIEKKLKK